MGTVTNLLEWAKKKQAHLKTCKEFQRRKDNISIKKVIKLTRKWAAFCRNNNLVVYKRIWSKKTIIWKVKDKGGNLDLILVILGRPKGVL